MSLTDTRVLDAEKDWTSQYSPNELDTYGLEPIVDQGLMTAPPKEYNSFRASSLGMCPRAHLLHLLQVPETTPHDARTKRVFKLGDLIHDMIQEQVTAYDPSAKIEMELYDPALNLGGRLDVLRKVNDDWVLYDIKSQNGFSYKRVRSMPDERILETQWPHHKAQATAYAILLERVENIKVDRIFIAYWEKENLVTRLVELRLTEDDKQVVLAEVAMLNKHLQAGTLPDCTCSGWKKEGCVYGNPGTRYEKQLEDITGRKYTRWVNADCCADNLYQT